MLPKLPPLRLGAILLAARATRHDPLRIGVADSGGVERHDLRNLVGVDLAEFLFKRAEIRPAR